MPQLSTSKKLFSEAEKYIPGGVNSPVRAFKAVGGTPAFINSAKGAYIFDEDGNKYIELINSWGPMVLGHAHTEISEAVKNAVDQSLSYGAPTAKEVDIAKLIVSMMPSVEKVRMVNSGTEATMSAVRLARGYTNRNKFIKFEGCYHGHADSFLIAAGSGAVTMGTPNSPGVTEGTAKDTLLAPYNDLDAVDSLVKSNPEQIAAIIVEPVAGNMGCVLPKPGFLEGLRKVCDENGIVLIFDEVMTGFRLAPGGAQEYFNVMPDLTCMGKIIGGGMPVGAYGGKQEIMDYISPVGPVYQAGTLSGNPIAMAAGYAMLSHLNENKSVYKKLNEVGEKIKTGYESNLEKLGLNYTINHLGSMINMFFTDKEVHNFKDAQNADTDKFKPFFHGHLDRGVYLPPSAFESYFLSTALSDEDIDKVVQTHYDVLKEMHS
ncbi:glutamate-1-semialdehyde 2,1-aminomutase [Chondrinema litorale]|uniref:glutamate-1-semialdehyde 2,1-aminomutase n=1 Tax=Chondrinema litorale TaxID=2994555 RepID=UPI0025447832|nr:glutamate-1-semialdehyde 2,1-aminomutase [Chondrinema litorale]UZR93874.1 glutamate-1-semialdehyde 2,1-aminomutase [Chondrinema litorale]